MIWATVCSQSCFCRLYRASPESAVKNTINLISVLSIWWCPCVESSLVLLEEDVCYNQCILLVKLKNPQPWNLLAYSFIIKEQVRRGEHLCLSWDDAMLPSSVPSPGWAEEFSYTYMVKLGPQIIAFYVCKKHVLTYWAHWAGCGPHVTAVLLFWGKVSCFCHMVLLLNKPAWFCG